MGPPRPGKGDSTSGKWETWPAEPLPDQLLSHIPEAAETHRRSLALFGPPPEAIQSTHGRSLKTNFQTYQMYSYHPLALTLFSILVLLMTSVLASAAPSNWILSQRVTLALTYLAYLGIFSILSRSG